MVDGMSAFAVYNSRTRRVLLARDRMGKKPLLYFMTGDTLIFASELNALRCHPQMPRELDETAISDFLSLHYIPCPNTVYRNVRKLPPAHQMELRFSEGTVSIRSYWHLDYSLKQNELSFDDAAHELRRLVERAVEKRLMTRCAARDVSFRRPRFDHCGRPRGKISRSGGNRCIHHRL